MGQYWVAVNLDKKEFISPHKLGTGAKIGEQLGSEMGSALIILTAAMRERRGGGDFDLDSNYYGPERTMQHSGSAPVVEEYNVVARRTIGRWAGDRVAMVGDYAEDSDLPARFKASTIYEKCRSRGDGAPKRGDYRDVTDDACRVIEHEQGGLFVGDGWRQFVTPYQLQAEITELEAKVNVLRNRSANSPSYSTRELEWAQSKLTTAVDNMAKLNAVGLGVEGGIR